ncbi:MAG: hypothetical protein K8F58_16295, partial [Bauldia sp.]|nr:hypothetical protein [Bauldia sp.]
NIHTIIESYSNCLSACAIVFAAGSDWEDGVVLPNRKMHYSATLGFHAPFVTLPGSQYSAEQAEKLFSAGLRAVARMMTLGDQGDGTGVIPNRVILELLKRGPGELYMVDTPLKADELGIDLLGVPKARWSKRKACNACLIKNQGRAVNDACDAMNDAPITLRRTGDVSLIFDGFGGEGAYQCIVKLRGDGVGRVEADIVPLATEDEFPLRDYEFLSLTDQDALDPWIPFSDLNGGN